MMKNQNLFKRFIFSLQGLKYAWSSENSFRTQVTLTCLIIPTILFLKASPEWLAIFFLIIGAALSAELFNTALEYLCDLLHPNFHPQVGKIKDCAAAAVLVLTIASILIFIIFLATKFGYP
jgi:diacylglycerol kinase (ATP)